MNRDAMFSSASCEWETPKEFFDRQDAVYHFDLDVCATPNAKCARYYTEEQDGLVQPWTGRCWMNPPYGRTIGKWVQKAYESVRGGGDADLVVCLLPARTDTAWWHDYCMKGEVQFIRGRLKFGNARNAAPFPSALVIFRRDHT